MRYLCLLFLACVCAVGHAQEPKLLSQLSELRWTNRILVIYEPEAADGLQDLLKESKRAFDERRLIWFLVFNGETKTNLKQGVGADLLKNIRRQLNPEDQEVLLIGLDGRVKVRDQQLNLDALYATIDAMPMRRAEARK